MNRIYSIIFFIALVFFTACSNTKFLAPGQNLFNGIEVKVQPTGTVSDKQKKAIKAELATLAKPQQNAKILGIRYKLIVYNHVKEPKKKKGFKFWLKYKVGEPPVIATKAELDKNSQLFQNRLENEGYFHDTVTLDSMVKDRMLKAVYTAYVGTQYTIRNVTFPQGEDTLSAMLRRFAKRTLLKKGNHYDLDVVKGERERFDTRLKEHGFYYFSPDDLVIKADSTVGDHQVDLSVQIKPQTPLYAAKPYRINDVVVYADYHINSDTSLSQPGVEYYQGYKIIDSAKKFKPSVFGRLLVFKKDSVYNRTAHNIALNRLITLGTFKFVKARFDPADTVGDYLNAFYYLTPSPKKSIRLTVTGLTKSDNSTGGNLAVNLLNRNTFRGAEQLNISPYVGLEQQFSSAQNAATRRVGADITLTVPHIISPFHITTSGAYVPRTKFQVGYQLFSSDTLYTLNSFTGSYGYVWKQSLQTENTLNIVNISYVRPTKISQDFQALIDTNITLKRSIEPQLILSSSYNYNLNTQARANTHKNNYYFNGNVEIAGNLLGLITHADVKTGKQVDIFNVPFSEFTRLELDFRYYHNFTQYTLLATRFWSGVGFSYGNSTSLPFARAFFAGGTNDIRAFASRVLGPGSYHDPADTLHSPFVPQQPGDIKLEASAEIRAKLFSIVRGALFVDAGNIWTQQTDTARPGSKFSGNFLNQIGAGVGAGLRFDVTILVLRLDVAYPVLKPYPSYLTPSRLVYNIAIGYPF